MTHRLRGLALAFLLAVTAAPLRADADDTVTVFAAASLAEALETIGVAYEATGRGQVVFNFAASSVLARQIEASGGADIFFSADTGWMDYLDARGLVDHATRRNLLGNRLVLIAPAGSTVSVGIQPRADLSLALGARGRLAVADPDSVPAGRYARAALMSLGMWRAVARRLVPAENVRAALAYVARGEAPLGIVYATDARIEPEVRVVGVFPAGTHPPIVYPAALVKGAKPVAAAFLRFLSGARAQAVFRDAGFIVPPDPG
jgi:molybdate transport system substrate-binding protein